MSAQSMELFDVWDTYKKVVTGDYMSHAKIGAALRQAVIARFAQRPYSMLDLGCGDASPLSLLFREAPPTRYLGVDLSATALALAAENLRSFGVAAAFEQADLLDTLSREEDLDVIYSSFALHHLDTAQKTEFFHRVARRLAPDGVLLLADVVREEDETLDTYKRRYMHWLRAGWTRLSPQEQEAICDHILAFDFPEPFSVLEAAARAAGLAVAKGGARCGWHRLMCFVKAEAFAPPV
jgi:ubiquinone/menaquinone biosynthesis C-methylase UbiE